MDRQRDGVTHDVAAACIVRGVDVAAGRQRPRSCHAPATPVSGRWLEALHTGWRCMRGVWRLGGRWRGRDAVLAVGVDARAKRRDQNGAQARTCKPTIEWARPVHDGVALAGFKTELGRTEQWAGSVRCTMFFQLFKNCPNLAIQVCCLSEFEKCPKFACS
jgi:hypothetical protein